MAVIIEPLGGLGNQLFVYAAGRALSHRLNVPLAVDLRNYHNYIWHDFELDSIDTRVDYVIQPQSAPSRAGRAWQRLSDRLNHQFRKMSSDGTFEEEGYGFDSRFSEIDRPVRLRGYFGSWRYFSGVEHEVRQTVSSLRRPSEWFTRTRQELDNEGPWTAVHVRRGNYKDIDMMGLAGTDYYTRSLDLLDAIAPDEPLVFFSDEPELIRGVVPFRGKRSTRTIRPSAGSRPIESMLLMSGASNLVIANSTFSWWAAWLGDRKGRRVIAPRPWLDGLEVRERDLLPLDWISLGRLEGPHA